MWTSTLSVLNVHTPDSSLAIVHSLTQEDLGSLYDKLTRKVHSQYHGQRVSPGWLKYEFNGTVWNLDDDSDYTIFTWRQQQLHQHPHLLHHQHHQHHQHLKPTALSVPTSPSRPGSPPLGLTPSSSTNGTSAATTRTPTLHLHDPTSPLPAPPAYQNPTFYIFRRQQELLQTRRSVSPAPAKSLTKSKRSRGSGKSSKNEWYAGGSEQDDGVPAFKRDFEKFHGENGVRTVLGSIGPVNNGYRHVYMSRKFALQHHFIPADAAPGHYGYSGLVSLGTWPITLTPSSSSASSSLSQSHLLSRPSSLHTSPHKTVANSGDDAKLVKPKPILIPVYLSEEPHFDVVLGRSFLDRRQIRMNAVDPTDVVCLDTGERIECELVILKDGRGEIVTVT
ncbi:hypothetical protein AX17_002848 [Amanita inopinata Kibby_2008]|nr:hypothetical protein AX17_002848 [Amanita inopinata Kibby_2008]